MVEELERWQVIDRNFTNRVSNLNLPQLNIQQKQIDKLEEIIELSDLVDLFNMQVLTRHIDIQARILKKKNKGYYSIASAGHEGNIALGYMSRVDDMALLHYRSSAFMLARAFKASPSQSEKQITDQLRSLFASKGDPLSGGRHKVFGSLELNVPPQTSTIASHLPKALGLALSVNYNKYHETKIQLKNQLDKSLKSDGVVLCSFGDASYNHSTAQGAINAAKYLSFEHIPLPLIYVCEDNNIGISVKTPEHWISSNFQASSMQYISADGLNLIDVLIKAHQALSIARVQKQPVFFHLKTVRLMGHAGSDIEQHYLLESEIINNESQDPLLFSAAIMLGLGLLTAKQIIELYESNRAYIQNQVNQLLNESQLESELEVMKSIIPEVKSVVLPALSYDLKSSIFQKVMPSWNQPRNLAQSMNLVLAETLGKIDSAVIFGEDVGKKGGVYRVTSNLQKYFGRNRVFDTILDEQTILGTAIGYAQNGLMPIAEIQFLAYIYNAIDQLRGEAATLPFFSSGKLACPMIIRVASFAYQKGFGGHFHNDNAIAILREIPGVIIAAPSCASSSVKVWREVVDLCYRQRRICIFLEPIALYFIKDLHQQSDSKMLSIYPDEHEVIHFGDISITEFSKQESSTSLVIISYANGHFLSLQAASKYQEQVDDGVNLKVIDLNWLHPLPIESLLNFFNTLKSDRVKILIVDECRRTGSISEELVTLLLEQLCNGKLSEKYSIARITGADSFIPLGPAANYVLPSVDSVLQKIHSILD